MARRWAWVMMAAIAVVAILLGTLAPLSWFTPFNGLEHSNAVHIAAHVGLFALLAMTLPRTSPRWTPLSVVLVSLLLAVATEGLQRFSPGRNPSLEGVFYDIAGALLGLALTFRHRREQPLGGTSGGSK